MKREGRLNVFRRIARDQTGASAIEFAICAPLFFCLLVGILSYGVYFGAVHSVSQLAADAARASISGLTDEERQVIALNHIKKNAESYPLVSPGKLIVTTGAVISPAAGYRVSVAYDASGLPMWFAFIPSPDPNIVRAAVITNRDN